jgi:predicted RNase H-like nuclease (RuvC/YqgF family)
MASLECHTKRHEKNNTHNVKHANQKENLVNTRGPNDLEERIEYYTNQNELLKKKLKQMINKYQIMEEEFDRLLEENNNFRIVRNKGKIL